MKRLLLFLMLITMSSDLFSNNLDKKQTNSKQEINLNKLKIAGAIAGSAFFAWSALLNNSLKKVDIHYQAQGKNVPLNFNNIPYYPSMLTLTPAIILHFFLGLFGNDGLSMPAGYNLSTAYSSIFATVLGLYAYKKFILLKKEEGDKPSIDKNLN